MRPRFMRPFGRSPIWVRKTKDGERYVAFSVTPEAIINDRKLRIKTLQATLDMLREATRPATGRTD